MLYLLLTILIVGAIPGTAQMATPDPANLPQEKAPFEIAELAIPAGSMEVEAILAEMPTTVAGLSRSERIERPDRTGIAYGDETPAVGYPLEIVVISFERGDFFPSDFTAGDYVAMALATDDVGSTDGGRDGDIAWVRAEISVGIGDRPGTPEIIGMRYTMAWGEVDGGWMVIASADSPAGLDSLMSTFVEVAGNRDLIATPAG